MPVITEVASDLYRLSVYVPEFHLQFNSFLVKDEEPLLFHAGLKGMFPLYREAVASLIEPSQLRWIAFSHFESDECGAPGEGVDDKPYSRRNKGRWKGTALAVPKNVPPKPLPSPLGRGWRGAPGEGSLAVVRGSMPPRYKRALS